MIASIKVDEAFAKAQMAEEIASQWSAQGRTLNWDPGVDPESAGGWDEMPPEVRKEAETRWAALDGPARDRILDQAKADFDRNVDAMESKLARQRLWQELTGIGGGHVFGFSRSVFSGRAMLYRLFPMVIGIGGAVVVALVLGSGGGMDDMPWSDD